MRWQRRRRTPNAAILQQVGVPASKTTSQTVTSTSSGRDSLLGAHRICRAWIQ